MGRSGGTFPESAVAGLTTDLRVVGVDVRDFGAANVLGTALSAAIASFDLTQANVIAIPPGNYTLDSTPVVPVGISGSLAIWQYNPTITYAVPRFLDIGRTADYQTFQNFSLLGPALHDGNNLGGQHHVLIGTYINGSFLSGQRLNMAHIRVHGMGGQIRVINLPVDPTVTNHRLVVFLNSKQITDNEGTPNTLSDIGLGCIRAEGGNAGLAITGTCTANGSLTNISYDDVWMENSYHSLLAAQGSGFSSVNFQIGGRAAGGKGWARNLTGLYSGDVGLEVDNASSWVDEGCFFLDAVNQGIYETNFTAPVDGVANQRVRHVSPRLKIDSSGLTGARCAHVNASANLGSYGRSDWVDPAPENTKNALYWLRVSGTPTAVSVSPLPAPRLFDGTTTIDGTIPSAGVYTNWPGPTGIRYARVKIKGAGGGGGSGGSPASNVNMSGGAGGSGGEINEQVVDLSGIATLTVTVGAAPNGGVLTTAGAGTGNQGTTGNQSSVAGGAVSITAKGGGRGLAGQTGTSLCVLWGANSSGQTGSGTVGSGGGCAAGGNTGTTGGDAVGFSGSGGGGGGGVASSATLGSAGGSAGGSMLGAGGSGGAASNQGSAVGAAGADAEANSGGGGGGGGAGAWNGGTQGTGGKGGAGGSGYVVIEFVTDPGL